MTTILPRNISPLPLIFLTADCRGNNGMRSQVFQMRLYRLLGCIVALTCISGCVFPGPVFPTANFSREGHLTEIYKARAETIIGETQESVIEKMGRPNLILADDKHQYMIYDHYSSANALMMWLFILPVGYLEDPGGTTLHCLKIDLDANNFVVDYQFKSTVHFAKGFSKCLNEYWKAEKWHSFENLPIPEPPQPPPPREWELKEGASWPNYGPPGSAQ